MTDSKDSYIISPPVVSVIMSVHNGLPHLADAVTSIVDQTFRDFEFIIIDDGSTDGSTDVIRRFASIDPRIIVIEQQNTGLTRALIRGVDIAKGEFIARMDADDVSEPERLETQVFKHRERPEAVAVSSRYWRINEVGEKLGLSVAGLDEAVIAFAQHFVNIVGGHGHMMFRRAAYDAAGGYNPTFRFTQDYDLWNRLALLGPVVQIERPLYQFRVGHGSISTKNRTKQIELAMEISGRSIFALTGVKLSSAKLAKLRSFFRRPSLVALGPRDISFIHSLVGRVEEATVDHPGTKRRSSVRRYLAGLWASWFIESAGYPLRAKAKLALLAITAHPIAMRYFVSFLVAKATSRA